MASAVIRAPSSIRGTRLTALPPLSLYVHVPWCVRKCPYCDFNSHEARGSLPEDDYVDALVADLESALPSVWGRRVYTVFFGGGTPSLFAARSIERLLAAIRARVPLDANAEITMEANPGTFESEKFRDFRAAGVNRLSIGIQSFSPRHLEALGRIHDGREAHRAVEIAQAHFENFNLDLMYALPGQTQSEARRDAQAAVASGAPHVSAYHLTIEPNTLFARRPPPIPDEDAAAAIQDTVEGALTGAGYVHYETSAYAKPGRESRHNLNYWRFGDYLGIGAGAHAKISFPDRIVREARARTPGEYMRRVAEGTQVVERRELTRTELPFEFMMNAMRLAAGFETALFAERTGLPVSVAEAPLALAEAKGLIERDALRIRPTERGRRFLNDLLELFLEPEHGTAR
ncbi:MAG: radical SAM family heme chaperone HemW [Burkholderiales bacterium]|jgi:oxygen-independent coproporphyrinogen-3 oxidase|nr:radical SAM family heme chaperone HemW [Burkholderiales bacterium]